MHFLGSRERRKELTLLLPDLRGKMAEEYVWAGCSSSGAKKGRKVAGATAVVAVVAVVGAAFHSLWEGGEGEVGGRRAPYT